MSEESDRTVDQVAGNEADLVRVQQKIDAARAVLVRLLQEVVVADSQLHPEHGARMLEANQELVISGLRSQADAVATMIQFDEALRAAELDALTQLPNRVVLLDRLHQAMAAAGRHGGRLALLFVDIDKFKLINDRLGHAAGDEVLRQVAQSLVATTRAVDTVCRWGGDEFVVLLSEVSRPSDAGQIAGKMAAALAALTALPRLIDLGLGPHLTASVGISIYPDDAGDAAALIAQADAAMYRAKRDLPGGHAFHGQPPAGADDTVATGSHMAPAAAIASPSLAAVMAAHELRHARLREANEQLVLAALGAQALQEAAEQAQLRQTEFMAVVARELGNPLAPIRIASAMLGRAGIEEPLLPRVQAIVEQQVTQMSRLVDNVLEASRGPHGQAPQLHCGVDMAAVITQAEATCRPSMGARRQRFSVAMPVGPLMVEGQATGLRQIISNLLDNASKYTPDGGSIELAVVPGAATLTLTLTDSGIGISAQALPDIFEPFVQDASGLGFNGVGVGIGLTAVRALVQAHGGTVLASSAGLGHGSRFVVTLPMAQH